MCNYLNTDKTMNKTYFAPATKAVNLNTEDSLMLTLSVQDPGTEVGAGGNDPGQLTRDGGWSSENWTDVEDEEL